MVKDLSELFEHFGEDQRLGLPADVIADSVKQHLEHLRIIGCMYHHYKTLASEETPKP